jgi:hypothetical protein
LKNARAVVKELLAGGEEESEVEGEDEDMELGGGGEEDLDELAFGGSGAPWELSSDLKDRLKGACHVAVDAFFDAL